MSSLNFAKLSLNIVGHVKVQSDTAITDATRSSEIELDYG